MKQNKPEKNTTLKIIIGIALLLGAISLLKATSTYLNRSNQTATIELGSSIPDHQHMTIYLKNQPLTVEIVNTSESTTQGLSGRAEIGADGMLFIFPHAQARSFWMKEMLFPIDIVWFYQGKIVGITAEVPIPDVEAPLETLPTYPSPGKVDAVLELPAGDAAKRGLVPGDVFLW